jgi:hypothetical protein
LAMVLFSEAGLVYVGPPGRRPGRGTVERRITEKPGDVQELSVAAQDPRREPRRRGAGVWPEEP